MSFDDRKITDQTIADKGVASAPDTLTGTPADNKLVFDRLPKEIADRLNGLIDDLQEAGSAAQLGVTPFEGVTAGNVQDALEQLQAGQNDKDETLRGELTGQSGAGMIGVTSFDGVTAGDVQEALQVLQDNLVTLKELLKSRAGAEEIGVTPFAGVASDKLQDVLEEIQGQIDDVTAGIIPDYGVTTIKLALQAVTLDRLAQEVVDLIEAAEPSRASTELDDYTMETGTFENAGAGWNSFRFREAFEGVPVVTVTPEEFAGFCEIKEVTAEGFLYCLRLPGISGGTQGSVSTKSVYVGAGTGTSPSHSAQTVVTAVTLPVLPTAVTSTTADPVKIHYTAIEYGGDR